MMTRRTALAKMASLAVCMILPGCGPARVDAHTIQQKLAKDVVLGSSSSQVLDYLSREKIEHSTYIRNPHTGNTVLATIPSKEPSWTVIKTSYRVLFRFDKHDRLTSFNVLPVYAGS